MIHQILAFLRKWDQQYKLTHRLVYGLSTAAVISGIITYFLLSGSHPQGDKSRYVLPLIYINLSLLLMLAVVIAKRLVEVWIEHKSGKAGSRLHGRFVVFFGAISVAPAIAVVIFSAVLFNFSAQTWFGEPVRQALNEASEVAEAYLNEHMKAISHDARAMVMELRPYVKSLTQSPQFFSEVLSDESEMRNLSEILVFDGNQQVIARSYLTFALEFEKISHNSFQKANSGEVVVISSENGDRVRALVKLDPITDTYLYIGKIVDPAILQHLHSTRGAVSGYQVLETQRSEMQISYVLFVSLFTLLLLFLAIWVGLTLANRLVNPIRKLIEASQEISRGNLSIQVDTQTTEEELKNLSIAFNHMTSTLSRQHGALKDANVQLDQRRKFTEAVLSGVSAGILGIDSHHKINLPNQRAAELLSVSATDIMGKRLEEVAPEISLLLPEALSHHSSILHRQLAISRRGFTRVLQVAIVVDYDKDKPKGFIITFDDITPLVFAQRKAAWSDVARKIAHEIKNPLTPIQLSAERLKRRYLKQITEDPQTFQTCIDTIVRQVQHIGTLVSEFSSFARMPEPTMKHENVSEMCRQAVFLQRQAHPAISFDLILPTNTVLWSCDGQQMNQVLTNLLQNAINAVTEYYESPAEAKIKMILNVTDQQLSITIEDNGPGLPNENREKLTEPYYTTREKGTGLGLAIVAKIAQDHHGELLFGDSTLGGAKIMLLFQKPTTNITSQKTFKAN